MSIFILDDCEARISQFSKLGFNIVVKKDAFEAISYLQFNLDRIRLISLDHDLMPHESRCGNLGIACGCFVADFLAMMSPSCPVMIHTSNEAGAVAMKYRLIKKGWNVVWVKTESSFPDNWIGSLWKDQALKALGNSLNKPECDNKRTRV